MNSLFASAILFLFCSMGEAHNHIERQEEWLFGSSVLFDWMLKVHIGLVLTGPKLCWLVFHEQSCPYVRESWSCHQQAKTNLQASGWTVHSMQNWLQISFRTWGVLPKQTVLERLICMPARVSNLWERSHAICKRATAAGAVAATLRRLLSSRKPPDEIVACGDMQSSMYRVHIANNAKEACKEKEQPWMKPLFLPHTCEEMAPLALYKHWNWL